MNREQLEKRLAQIENDIADKIIARRSADDEEKQLLNCELDMLYNEKYDILEKLCK